MLRANHCLLVVCLTLALGGAGRADDTMPTGGAGRADDTTPTGGTWDAAERLFDARDYAAARTAYLALLGSAPARGLPAGLLDARIAVCDLRLGHLPEGDTRLERALDAATEAGEEGVEGTIYRYMGRSAASRGQAETARGFDWMALALHERLGDGREVLHDRLALARDEYERNPDMAWGLYAEAVETAESLEDGARLAVALQGLAGLSQRFGDEQWAANLYGQARRVQEERGDTKAALETRAYETMLRVRSGAGEAGLVEIDALTSAPGLPPEMVRSLRIVGAIAEERLGRYAAARARLEHEVDVLRARDASTPLARGRHVFVVAARLERKLGHLESARALLAEAGALPAEDPEVEASQALEAASLADAAPGSPGAGALFMAAAAAGEHLRAKALRVGTGARFYGGRMTEELRQLFSFHAARGELSEAHAVGRILKGIALSEALRREGRAPPTPGAAPNAVSSATALFGDSGRAERPAAALNTLRRHLPPRSVLLDQYVLDDELVLFWISSERVAMVRIPIGAARLEAQVADFRVRIRRRDSDWRAAATTLGNEVLLPFRGLFDLEDPEFVLVSPHGVLHGLPFEALMLAGEPLAAARTVAYLPVPTMPLLGSASKSAPSAEADALGPALIAGDPDRTLPAAREEARMVGRWLGATPRLGEAASLADFRGAGPRAGTIHLATHAAQPSGDEPAWIQFADGRLAPWQIRQLRLRADLVVLSACETGIAPVTAGDESPEALDRAFLVAGARTVVASRWPVDDAATGALMRRFYAGLDRGPASALAIAMREVQLGGRAPETVSRGLQAETDGGSAAKWSHPYYWAAFKVSGDPRALGSVMGVPRRLNRKE